MSKRCKDVTWSVPADESGMYSLPAVQVALLMDLRDELKRLNELLHCENFLTVPRALQEIRRNTKKVKRNQLKAKGA